MSEEDRKTRFGGIRIVTEEKEEGKPGGDDLFSEFLGISREAAGEERERTERQEEGNGEEEKNEFQGQVEKLLLLVQAIDGMEEGAEKTEGEAMLANLIKALYIGLTQEYRPVLKHLLPIIGELLGKDLNLVLLPFLRLSNEVGESEEVKEERQRGRENRASTRKAILDAYTKAGFTPDQAMTLLLHDISPSSGSLTQVAATAASSAINKASGPVAEVAASQARKRGPGRKTVKE